MAPSIVFFVATALAVATGVPLNDESRTRVVGGTDAPDGLFGYQIVMKYRDSNYHFCGGSIIDATTILTAAHCVIGKETAKLSVVVGTNKLDEGGVEIDVERFVRHANFTSTNENDIALLKLSTPIEYSAAVRAVELETEDVGGDVDVVFTGFGATQAWGPMHNELQYVYLKTLSVADCRPENPDFPIYDSQVCTFTKEGEGVCGGDSGGPLVTFNWRQIGVLSWGRPCARGRPDTFTRVSSFIDWINANK